MVCCSVLQCDAVCCSVLQCHVTNESSQYLAMLERDLRGVLQCDAVCCSVLQCVAVCYTVLYVMDESCRCFCNIQEGLQHCVAVCCSVLQRVAVSCHE